MPVDRNRIGVALVTAGALTAAIATAGIQRPVAAAAPAGVRVSEPYRLGREIVPVRVKEVPGLAVDPNDPTHVVEIDLDVVNERCRYNTSFDRGRTWVGGTFRVPDGFIEPPCYPLDISNRPPMYGSVVFGSRDRVYATFAADIHNGTPDDIGDDGTAAMVARSTDGGRTFKTAVEAIPAPPEKGSGFNRTSLAVIEGDPDQVFVFALKQRDNPASTFPITDGIVVAASADGGRTFGPFVEVNEPGETGVGQAGLAASGPDGTLYLPWRRGVFGSPSADLRLAVSTDEGQTWTRSTIASIQGLKEPLSMVVDRSNGIAYIAYQTTREGDFDIEVIHSTDRGATWSAPVRVNDDAPGNGVPQVAPALSIGPGTRLNVTWYDGRDAYPNVGPATGLPATTAAEDVYYAYSLDGAHTFSDNHRIGDRTINRDLGSRRELGAHYPPRSGYVGAGKLLVAWTDSRDGSVDTNSQDVYLAHVALDPAGRVPAGTIAARSLGRLSIELSRWTWPGGAEERNYERLTRVVIVNRNDPQSALPAVVLARAFGGPILLSGRSGLSKALEREVARLQPDGAFLVGDATRLSDQVGTDARLRGGFPSDEVVRVAGASPAETAKLVAEHTLPIPDPDPEPPATTVTFPAAVAVNPDARSAAAAAAFAAQSAYPILFVARDSIPTATQQAIDEYLIDTVYVIGPETDVGASVAAALPGTVRVAGARPAGTFRAVVRESIAQGLPHNVVFVSDSADPTLASLLASTVARRSGVHLLARHAAVAAARTALTELGIAADTDRIARVRLIP